MTLGAIQSNNHVQREFEERLQYVLENKKLESRPERIAALIKMYVPHGYEIPHTLRQKLIKNKLLSS